MLQSAANASRKGSPSVCLSRPPRPACRHHPAHPVVQMRMTGRPIQHGAGDAEIVMLPRQTFIDDPALRISGSSAPVAHKRAAPPVHPQSRLGPLANRCAEPPTDETGQRGKWGDSRGQPAAARTSCRHRGDRYARQSPAAQRSRATARHNCVSLLKSATISALRS